MAKFSERPPQKPAVKVAPPARSTAPSTAGSKPFTMPLVGKVAPANISQYMPRPAQPAALAEPVISMDKGRLPPGMKRTPEVQKPSGNKNFMPELTIPVDASRTDLGPKQPSSRLGTPISIKDAPGYRGIGTPLMPSSLSMRAKKGGVITTRKISTATKSKKQSSW
jgi:hypothetical protein